MLNELNNSWGLVAHACNPSYSGGRGQEDYGLKPARANGLGDPLSKGTQSEGPEFKPQYHTHKIKE
jgi:hypothetical protein